MSLTLNRPANAALMVMMIASTTLVAAPVNASGREAAPVRYGSSDRTSGNDKGRVIQAPIASRASGSFFAYPDEPINGRLSSYSDVSGRTPDAKAASYTKVADLGLPYVSPVEYASYVKVGKPYKKFGKTYKPDIDQFYNATGIGSWYGSKFHGNLTANGEVYDMNSFTAAHPTLPLPCFVEVTNLENGKSLVVRVNDRGPFAKNRIIDLSKAAAIKLDMVSSGSANVRVKYLAPAPQATSPSLSPVQQEHMIASVSDLPSHFVQLGSFKDKRNAQGMLESVKTYAPKAGLVYANVNGGDYYRVVVGPYDTKSQAESERSSIAGHGFQGIVILNQ